jgi:multisubunit Na+/H+ antiporter MnhB subunit
VTCRRDFFNDVSLQACAFTNFVNKILINTLNLQAIMEVIAFDLQITSN